MKKMTVMICNDTVDGSEIQPSEPWEMFRKPDGKNISTWQFCDVSDLYGIIK